MNPGHLTTEQRLLELLTAFREEGDLKARAELNERLREDPAARSAIARLLVDEQALIERLRQDDIVALLEAPARPRVASPSRRPSRTLPLARIAVAAALVLTGFFVWMHLDGAGKGGRIAEHPPEPVAVIRETADAVWRESELPPGKELVREDFSKPNATTGWRWGAGKWTVADGVLKGTETAERKHAAGIACPRDYHDAVIDFRFRFDGGNTAMLLLRNRFGNLCRLTLTPTGARLTKDKPNLPQNTPEKTVELDAAKVKLAPGEWHTVRATVRGGRFDVVLDGRTTLEGRHPGIDVAKTEIEFLAGGASVLFDDLVARHLDSAIP